MADKFIDCIRAQITAQEMDGVRGGQLIKDYESLMKKYRNNTAKASEEVLANAALKKLEFDRKASMQAAKLMEIKERRKNTPHLSESEFWRGYLQQTAYNAENVEKVMIGILTPETKKALQPELFGLKRNHELIEKIVRSMLGEEVDDALATSVAKNVREMFDYGNTRLIAAGSDQKYLKNYFPQVHSVVAMRGAGRQPWVNKALQTYDYSKTKNPFTNGNFEKVEDFEKFLGAVWDNKVNGVAVPGVENSVFAKHELTRSLHAKSPEHFINYNKEFGTGEQGLFTIIQNYMRSTSKDVAVFENLGIMPLSTKRMMVNDLAKAGFKGRKSLRLGEFNLLTNNFTPGDSSNIFYKALSGTLNLMRTRLGGAGVTAVLGDPIFTYSAAVQNGIEPVRIAKNHIQYLTTLGKAEKFEKSREGLLIIDTVLKNNANDTRHAMNWLDEGPAATGTVKADSSLKEKAGHAAYKAVDNFESATGKLSQAVHQLSGLDLTTTSTEAAVTLATGSRIGNHLAKKGSWADLNVETKNGLSAFGFQEKDWDFLLKHHDEALVELEHENMAFSPQLLLMKTFENVEDIKTAQRLVNVVDGFYSTVAKVASNEPTLTTKAITSGAYAGERVGGPGTALRAAHAAFFLFKSFGITAITNHVNTAFRNTFTPGKSIVGMKQLGALTAGGMVLGAISTQLGQIFLGREPMKWDDKNLWYAGFLKSGGYGFYGETLFTDRTRGRNMLADLAGPMGGLINDSVVTAQKGFKAGILGDDKAKFGLSAFKLMKNNMIPGVTSLFYTKLLADRFLLDHIERFSDSDYDKRIRGEERRRFREYEQKSYWGKGKFLP